MTPLAIDLFCGLGGWTDALIAEGYYVVGFDITRHVYGDHRYPAQLVLQDVLTLHGSQFKDAALIVASPPCQEYSYMAMPWKRAKAKAAAIRADDSGQKLADLNRLFSACFRLQREACETAGRHIPLVVENVRGAVPWVGQARWNFGSYYLWGDVPALMPKPPHNRLKGGQTNWRDHDKPGYVGQQLQDHFATKNPGFRFDGRGRSFQSESVDRHIDGYKSRGMNWSDQSKRGQDFTRIAGRQAMEGRKGSGAGAEWFDQNLCSLPSKSPRRKHASAMIAKIPFPLARHIAATFKPKTQGKAA